MAWKWPCVVHVPGENPWVTYAKRQVWRKNNCLYSIWTGQPGSGKSWGMLSYFCLINPDFELEGNWYFKAPEFMRAIKDYYQGKPKSGKLWGYDEGGIDANNLNYYDEFNKGLNAFFQTSRHKNPIVALSVPYMSLISKGVRMLMTAEFKANGWTRDNHTKLRPLTIEYDGDQDKFYKKSLLVITKSGTHKCCAIELPKPPKRIVREYESLKKEFTSNLFEEIADKMTAQDEKNKAKYANVGASGLTKRQEEVLHIIHETGSVIDTAKKTRISVKSVYETMKACKKKGILIEPKRDGEGQKVTGYKIEGLEGIDS